MDITKWRRGVGTLAAVATLAASATYAHANTISVAPVQAATGPNTHALYNLVDESGTQSVAAYTFHIYYKSSQATLYEATDVDPTADSSVAPGHGDAFDIEQTATDDTTRTDDPHDLGFTNYKVVDGNTALDPWDNRGVLAQLDFLTATSYTGQIDILVQPVMHDTSDPEFNSFYYDGNVAMLPVTISDTPTQTYGSPVITAIDHEGTWLGTGDVVTVTGTGFFSDGPGPAPDTVFTYNGQTLAATINSPTEAEVTIPVFSTLPGPSTEYADLPLNASNGSGYVDNSITYTLVSQDKVYVDDDWASGFATHKRVATGKIAGGNAFALIGPAAGAVNANGDVSVAAGDYVENASIATAMTITGDNGATVKSTGSGYHQVLMNVGNADVTIDNLDFVADEFVGAAILSDSVNHLTVKNSDVEITGVAAVPSNRGLATVPSGMGSNWGTRGIAKRNGAITLQGNTVKTADPLVAGFMYGVQILQADAVVGSADFNNIVAAEANDFSGSYRDIEFSYSNGAINGNTFALNMDLQNPDGPVDVYGNSFGNVASVLHNEAALTVRHNHDGYQLNIKENTFVNTGRGVWVGASENVAVEGNTFTPAAVVNINLDDLDETNQPELDLYSDRYTHIMLDTRAVASNGAYDSSSVTVANNTFNDSAADGDAIEVKNLKGTLPTAPSMTLAFSGNNFNGLDGVADNYVALHNSFAGEVNLTASNVAVGTGNPTAAIGSSWSLADLFTVEDHTFHALDLNGGTGVVRWVAQNLYVTDLSDKIQRGVDAATVGDTIHVQAGTYAEAKDIDPDPVATEYIGLDVDKQVTLLGPNAGLAGVDSGRGAEALIVPGERLNAAATMSPGPRISDWHPVVIVEADSAVFDGFAISGENSALVDAEGPATVADLSLSASTGLYIDGDSIVVQNNKLDSFSYIGLWSAGYWASYYQNDDVVVSRNLVQKVHSSDGYGHAYYIGGSSGTITDNYAVNVRSGLNIQPYDNVGTVAVCSGNHLNAWSRGLWYNYSENNTTPWHFSDNHVTAVGYPASYSPTSWDTTWTGLVTQTQYASGPGGLLELNTVDGAGAPTGVPSTGVRVHSSILTPTDDLVFEQNDVQNVDTGVAIMYDGTATHNGRATFQNNNEIHHTEVAFDIDGTSLLPQIINGNNIHDNDVGIRVRNGGVAAVDSNTLVDNAIQLAFEVTGATDSSVTVGANTYAPANKLAAELEAIVNGNALTGKTYISTGMAATQGAVVAENAGAEQFTYVRNTIGGSINAPATVAQLNTVKVMAGAYDEGVLINKTLRLQGAAGLVSGVIPSATTSGVGVAVNVSASNSIVDGLAVTRVLPATNNWGTPALYTGIQIHQSITGCTIQNNSVSNFWNGVYLNDCPNNDIVANAISNNRHGIQICNNITDTQILNNEITGNWFSGIGFNEPGSTVLKTTALTIRNNNISGNGAYEVSCDWVAAKTDVLDLSGNWFGTAAITIDQNPTDHAGLEALTPGVLGTDVATIGGIGTDTLVDYNAYLASSTDSDTSPVAFEGDFSHLYVVPSPLAGTEESHIHDAVALLDNGALTGAARLINVTPGTYTDGVAVVDKAVQIVGTGATRDLAEFNPKNATQNGIEVQADDVKIQNLTLAGVAGSGPSSYDYLTAVNRVTGPFSRTTLQNVAISGAGSFGAKKYAVTLGQPKDSANSTGNVVSGCSFDDCDYAGLALLGGETVVSGGNTFTNMVYQGIYAAPDGNQLGGTRPVITVAGNFFNTTPVGVRLNTVANSSVIGDAGANAPYSNTFTVGNASDLGIGVSIEACSPTVSHNSFGVASQPFTNSGETLDSMAVWAWDSSSVIANNEITGTGSGTASGVVAVGKRIGQLAGGGTNMSTGTNLTIAGNTITDLNAGVVVNNSAVAGSAASISVNNSGVGATPNSIKDNTIGVLVDGAFATANVDTNWIYNNDTGIKIVEATAASTFNSNSFSYGASTQNYMENTSGNDYDVSNSTYSGVTPDTVGATSYADMWAIQDHLIDALNEAGNGHLILADNYVYVPASKIGLDTATNSLLTRADLVAADGDTVAVQPGTYGDGAASITHNVALLSPTPQGAIIQVPVAAELSAASDQLSITDFAFSGNGSVVVADTDENASAGSYVLQGNQFSGLSNSSVAVTVDRVVVTGSIEDNVISNSGNGIVLNNVQNTTVDGNSLTDNFGTGITALRSAITGTTANPTGIVGTGLAFTNNIIANSGRPGAGDGSDAQTGLDGDSAGTVENGQAYGIFVGGTAPSATDLDISYNTITGNGATGVALWSVDGDDGTNPPAVTVVHNTIENNGIWREGDAYNTYHQNTDGLKLNKSLNVAVTQNFIRDNVRSNVTISGSAANSGEGVLINSNHLERNKEIVNNAGEQPSFGAGLLLQIYSPQAGSTTVDANNNWWGHVYGPSYTANPTGRGTEIVLQGGLVDASTWYGQRDVTHKWFALNDRDGDGVLDADEDLDLDLALDGFWGYETGLAVKDFDGDGYEDGAEVACGSDPLDPAKTPADPAGDGSVAAHTLAAYANSTADADGDRYLDFYEVAQGTDPTAATGNAEFPSLGEINTALPGITAGQVSTLRRILVGAAEFTDANINQDNGDVNRDGIVNNADVIFLRRHIADNTVNFPIVP